METDCLLIAVLMAIHLGEGIHALPRGAWCFRRTMRGRWHADSCEHHPMLRGRRLAMGGFLPRQICFPVQAFPLLAGPSGISNAHRGFPGSPETLPHSITWNEADLLTANETRLCIQDKLFCRSLDVGTTRRWKRNLQSIAALPPPERVRALRTMFRTELSVREAKRRWRRFATVSGPLQVAAWMQFSLLFVLLPVLLVMNLLSIVWPVFVAVLLLNQTGMLFWFTSSRRRIHPDKRVGNVSQLISMFFSPPYLIRAPEILAQDLFEGLHPLAVASVLFDRAQWREMAGGFMRPLCHPFAPPEPADPIPGDDGLPLQQEEFERWLEAMDLPPKELLEPPPTEGGAVAYCPRCHALFLRPEGTCSDCPGIELRSL